MDASSVLPFVRLAIIVSAGISIAAHYTSPPQQALICSFKPLTTILIVVMALLPGTLPSGPYARAIVIGLLFSLAGDIFLVLPDKWFLYGLLAFLLAHISYIFAFRDGAAAPGFVWALLGLGVFGAAVLTYIWKGVPVKMKGPVIAYIAVILSMAALAVGRWLGQPSPSTASAAAGALLFVASDAMLAIKRFRRPFRLAQGAILMTYFAAQYCIAMSVG